MDRLAMLANRAAEIEARLDAIETAASETDGGNFTDEQSSEYQGLVSDLAKVKADVERLQERNALRTSNWLRDNNTQPGEAADAAREKTLADDEASGIEVVDRTGGPFATLGEQLGLIYRAAGAGAVADERLYKVATGPSGSATIVGADAGFLIQPQFGGQLYDSALEMAVLASRCDSIPIGPNADRLSYWYPEVLDRTTGNRWGGVRAYWRAEAEAVTKSGVKLSEGELKLQDLMAITYATQQQLDDSVQYEALVARAFAEEMSWELDETIFTGNGVGKPLGILNAPALVTVAAEGSQVADTIVAENVIKMWARMPQRSRGSAVWLVNAQVEEQLPSLKITSGAGDTQTGSLVYMPPGGLSGLPYGTLQGRPVLPCEHCPALGDVGDIVFADLQQYLLIRKGGIKSDVSMHVRFLNDEQTFRWTMRANGMAKWRSSMTLAKANAGFTLSPFVTLAERA